MVSQPKRTQCTTHALLAGAVGLVVAVVSPSASHAAGVLVQGDGSFIDGPTEYAELGSVRALLVQQEDEVTVVLQAATAEGVDIGSAWIVPIPGTILMEPATADPAILDELLRVTDPVYEALPACAGGCATTVGDTGALAEIRFFDDSKASANWNHFASTALDSAILSLEGSGFEINSGVAEAMAGHAAAGHGFVVVNFTGDSPSSASPAVVVRYQSSELLLPQAITANRAYGEVQTAVLTLTTGPTGPEGMVQTTPKLGLPLYQPQRTSEFYQGRVRVALEQAGGDAWVLEYSNTLDELRARRKLLLDKSVLWDPNDDRPWMGLQSLVNQGLMEEFDPAALWVTRWRTFQTPEQLRDQRFIPDDNVPAYEVYVSADQFGASTSTSWVWTLPLFLGGWAFRRRRKSV